MRKFQHLLLVFALIILGATSALAVPAYPNPIEFTQPDGTKISIMLKGDEKIKWAQTLDGYSLLFNSKGYYEYAIINDKGDMVPSGVRANDLGKQTIQEKSLLEKLEKGFFYSESQVKMLMSIWEITEKEGEKGFPTTGDRSLVCILVGFTDKAFTKTQAEFNNLFNQVGYTTGGATGSVKDYYLENSYNQFNLTVDVAGPYTVSHNMAYYGGNDADGDDLLPRAMVSEAVVLADGDVNFANYDNDNNGAVDGVYVIFAGYGEEAGGPANAIWSHASSINPTVTLDGKSISRYSCSPELRDNYGTNITRIGVICHEFGHVLGAKDYYDTNYGTGGEFEGTGNWDIMANGSWNNGGATPAHHNGYTKVYVYNWATATQLTTTPLNVVLQNAVENSNSFYRISTTTTNEFFFIENRYKHKFDAYIPASGMIIYHVKGNISLLGNTINATHPQGMYPVSANASMEPTSTPSSYGSINSSTCAWPTTKTAFTDTSIPSSKSWAGANTSKPITNITKNTTNKTVSFYFLGGVTWPSNFQATSTSDSQIELSWNKTENKDVLLAYSTTGVFGVPSSINYTVSSNIDGGGTVIYTGGLEAFNHTNLMANTKYYYKIWSKLTTDPTWSTGQEVNATTQPCTLIEVFPFEEYFNSAIAPTCWDVVPTVATHTWQLTTGYTASSIPVAPVVGTHFFYCPWNLSLDQNELLTLPSYNLTLLESPYLKFWFNGSYTTAVTNNKCDLKVLVKVNGGMWVPAWDETNHPEFNSSAANYQWLLAKVDLSAYKTYSNVQIAFQYTGKTGSNFAIDDILVYNHSPLSAPTTIQNHAVAVFPNPFQSELKINSEFKIEKLTIVNLTGQVIVSFSAINSKEKVFNLSNLQSGAYFVTITGKNGQKANQMVVKQ